MPLLPIFPFHYTDVHRLQVGKTREGYFCISVANGSPNKVNMHDSWKLDIELFQLLQ